MNGLELARKMAKYQYGGAWRGRFASEDAATARLAVMADAIGLEPEDFGVTFRDVNRAWRIAPYASAYDRARSIVADADARAAADAIAAELAAELAADVDTAQTGATDAATAARALAKDGRREDGQRMAAMGAMAARAVGQFVTAADAAPDANVEDVTVGETVIRGEDVATVAAWARDFAADCEWQETSSGHVDCQPWRKMTDAQVIRTAARHYDGGARAMAADAIAADAAPVLRDSQAYELGREDAANDRPMMASDDWRGRYGADGTARFGYVYYVRGYDTWVREHGTRRAATAVGAFLTRASVAMVRHMLAATPYVVDRVHSGTEDGHLWRVTYNGRTIEDGWLHEQDALYSAVLYAATNDVAAVRNAVDDIRAAYLLGITDDGARRA